MEYAQTYFGKSLTSLQLADIEHFFTNERAESDQIEFKSFHNAASLEQQLPTIIRGITAFLNSSGGLLIWGAPKGSEVKGKKEKVFVGSLTPLPLSIEKDWLISKIADKIIPLPRGFRVQLIASTDGQIAVFEVDESPYSPHQTEGIYYMRIDGQNKPAPHHYIDALFKKVAFPTLEAYFKPGHTQKIHAPNHVMDVEFLFCNLSPFLNEERLSFKIALSAGHFLRAVKNTPLSHNYAQGGREYHSHSVGGFPLLYGEPYKLKETLYFEEKELVRMDGIVSITVTLGGKTAPIKYCQYYLKFHPSRTAVTCWVEIENRLMSDLLREQGRTQEDTIRAWGAVR